MFDNKIFSPANMPRMSIKKYMRNDEFYRTVPAEVPEGIPAWEKLSNLPPDSMIIDNHSPRAACHIMYDPDCGNLKRLDFGRRYPAEIHH